MECHPIDAPRLLNAVIRSLSYKLSHLRLSLYCRLGLFSAAWDWQSLASPKSRPMEWNSTRVILLLAVQNHRTIFQPQVIHRLIQNWAEESTMSQHPHQCQRSQRHPSPRRLTSRHKHRQRQEGASLASLTNCKIVIMTNKSVQLLLFSLCVVSSKVAPASESIMASIAVAAALRAPYNSRGTLR